MKKIVILFCILMALFVSCSYDIYPEIAYEHTFESKYLFVVKNHAVTKITSRIPITIYNPNDYEINIIIDNKKNIIIQPISLIRLQTLTFP